MSYDMSNVEGLKKYKDIICHTCNIKYLGNLNKKELDGCLGVAIVLAFINGINANLFDMSNHLKINYHLVEKPFNLLKLNGIFSESYNAKEDRILKGTNKAKIGSRISSTHSTEIAWGIIAGIAMDLIGLKQIISKKKLAK